MDYPREKTDESKDFRSQYEKSLEETKFAGRLEAEIARVELMIGQARMVRERIQRAAQLMGLWCPEPQPANTLTCQLQPVPEYTLRARLSELEDILQSTSGFMNVFD